MRYVLALDQGTTSSRAILFDESGAVVASHSVEFRQIYPRPAWVEHDPEDIFASQVEAMREAVRASGVLPSRIACVGITNQRETTVVWDRQTGKPLYNAIVWQCRRTAQLCGELDRRGLVPMIKQKTGLILDAYFSGPKLRWLLDNVPEVREAAAAGRLCFGTVDSFLLWRLTGGVHATDATNASRTMLMDIHAQRWDDELLAMLDIPRAALPEIADTAGAFGTMREEWLGAELPITAMAGDQHAALFGQLCHRPGMAKNTYGTGCFMLMNTGDAPASAHDLLTTVAWRLGGKTTYALEGGVFVGGAVVQWLRDELRLISTSAESELVARSVPDTGGVYLVPAFTGLGAPHWDMYARGTLVGITRGTGRAQIVRAGLESIAFQSCDVIRAMERACGMALSELRVDGGASRNDLLMQFQADMAGAQVVRPYTVESTALGAAMLAGLAAGVWSMDDLPSLSREERRFVPAIAPDARAAALKGWSRAVSRSLAWAEE